MKGLTENPGPVMKRQLLLYVTQLSELADSGGLRLALLALEMTIF
jgi:hypothetical protein